MVALTTELIWYKTPFLPANRLCLPRGGFTNVLGAIALYSSFSKRGSKTRDQKKGAKVLQPTALSNKVEPVNEDIDREHAKSLIPQNTLVGFYSSLYQSVKGKVYAAQPFKMRLYPDKKYFWCSCGHSKTQPFCDGTHKTAILKVKMAPIVFSVPVEKDYWVCNCKQSSHRPFCDGTHNMYDLTTRKLKSEMLALGTRRRHKRGKRSGK